MTDQKIKKELLSLKAIGFVFDPENKKMIGATFESETDAILAQAKIKKTNGELKERVFKKRDLVVFHPTYIMGH